MIDNDYKNLQSEYQHVWLSNCQTLLSKWIMTFIFHHVTDNNISYFFSDDLERRLSVIINMTSVFAPGLFTCGHSWHCGGNGMVNLDDCKKLKKKCDRPP